MVFLAIATGARKVQVGLDLSYSFAAAEDFARANRKLFAVSDLEAEWRNLPITGGQKSIIRSCGFKDGIDELTRGMASMIISGILNTRKRWNA